MVVVGKNGEKIRFEDLSKGKIVNLISKLSFIRKHKYEKNRNAKYGNINRGFTEKELKLFLSCCKNKKAYLAFFTMANLGLRVGEVVKIKLEDLDFVKNKIRISTEKAHTGDFLYLHSKVQKLLFYWVQNFQDEIVKHEGYVLFSSNKKQHPDPHISPHWLRKVFREIAYISGLNEHYSNANKLDTTQPRCANRKLYRLTTHSLRHYYITHVYNNCKNPVYTQKLARHRDFKSTQVYIHTSQEDLDGTMRKIFDSEDIEADDKDVEDFAKFWKLWRTMKNEQ